MDASEAICQTIDDPFEGETMPMIGESADHHRVLGNLICAVTPASRAKGCHLFFKGLRLIIASENLATYPDLMLVWGDIETFQGRDDSLTNPGLLLEVMSPSSRERDQGAKFHAYRRLDSLQTYVLVDASRPLTVVYQLKERFWDMGKKTEIEDSLILPSLDLEIPLTEIYRGVSLDLED